MLRRMINIIYVVFLLHCITSTFFTVFAVDELPEVCPNIITKNEWGGRGALQLEYTVIPVEYVIIHHTVTPTCRSRLECSDLLKSIQNFHMDELNYDDIAYNFMVGGDGRVYQGRGWHKVGAHTKGHNSKSMAVAFLGTFSDKLPTETQLQAAKDLIQCGAELEELARGFKLYGARQLSATQSPGLKLYNEIQSWPHFTKRV